MSPWPVVKGVANQPVVALRRFRVPVPVRVRVDQGRPVRVISDRRGVECGGVAQCAWPWRTSGGWWTDLRVSVSPSFDRSSGRPEQRRGAWPVGAKGWDRDEWDVTLSDGATYRIFRDRTTGAWFIEGIVD